MATSAERQRNHKARLVEQGLCQCNIWVPAECLPELQRIAELMRANRNLVAGPCRDVSTGKLVSLKSKKG
jgi:hypothetical protein